jgi:hypothetical protein
MRKLKRREESTSIYKGVRWCSREKLWHAVIRVNGRLFYLGSFRFASVAGVRFDEAARYYLCNLASVNYPYMHTLIQRELPVTYTSHYYQVVVIGTKAGKYRVQK